MAERTAIEWADSTFNPWIGCTKISPACDHCYAETLATARLGVVWGPNADRKLTTASWKAPLKWQRQAAAFYKEHGRKRRVFCASLADVMDNKAPEGARARLAELIIKTPDLIWLLLTKRIGNAAEYLRDMFPDGVPENVWLGITICNQEEAERDLPKLDAVAGACRLGRRTFLSIEPLLGRIDLPDGFEQHVGWALIGGESGPGSRPFVKSWAQSLIAQCEAVGVPVLYKQHGDWAPADVLSEGVGVGKEIWGMGDDVPMIRVGKKVAGRRINGRTYDGLPQAMAS